LVFHSSTIAMMHGPINISTVAYFFTSALVWEFSGVLPHAHP